MKMYIWKFIDLPQVVPFIQQAKVKCPIVVPKGYITVSGKDLLRPQSVYPHGCWVNRKKHGRKSHWLALSVSDMKGLWLYKRRPEDQEGHTEESFYYDEMSAILSITTKGHVTLKTPEDIMRFLAD